MRRYIVGRLLLMLPTLIGVAVITFIVMRLVPGDIVALRYAGSPVGQDIIDKERHILGLDKSMPQQFVDWMTSAAHLDFGQSLWTGHQVIDEIWTRLPLSLELAVIATVFAVLIAVPLGVMAAVRQDTWVDYAIRVFSVGGLAMPSFWIGIMLVLFTITAFGWAPPLVFTPITEDPVANLSQLVLPAISVGYRYSAVSMRMTRSTLLDVLREDYVRTALLVGFTASIVGCTLGLVLGVVGAYLGGRTDMIIQRLMDILISFPLIVIAIAVVAALGTGEGLIGNVIAAITVPIIPRVARVVRSSALTVVQMPYIEATRSVGTGAVRIMFRHVAPNVFAPYLIMMTAFLGQAILLEASLSFLGLGVFEPTPSWGLMLRGAGMQFLEVAPWLAIAPGVAISLAVFGFNLFGDSLRDALDPRLRTA